MPTASAVKPAHPFFEGLHAPLHIAHRGGAALAPENTMLAFRAAVETWRTDVLELDIRATRDGHVVVFHDETVERVTDGSGRVSDFTLAQLQALNAAASFAGGSARAQVPLLTEVMSAFATLRVNIELKSADVLEPFARLAQQHQWLSRVCIGSEHDALAADIAKQLPEALCFYPRDALATLVMSIHGGDGVEADPRYRVLDMPLFWEGLRVFNSAVAKACEAHGIWVNVWTVDDEAEMRLCLDDGVHGIMTDRPDVLRRVLESRRSSR